MNAVSIIMVIFSMLAAVDRILGNRFGLGREFERGFMLLGTMMLTMTGMISLAPVLADLLRPAFSFVSDVLHLDPSIIPASLFANDMGGAPLSVEVAGDAGMGLYNALVTSSMMGCTVSFTIPYALGAVKKEQHRELLLGLLCGVVTIPIGCLLAGFMCALPLPALLLNLLPLLLFAGIIAIGLIFAPGACVKIFGILGKIITILITLGLALGVLKFLVGLEPIKGLAPIEEGGAVCLNAAIVMSGAFPLMYVISRLFAKPLRKLGGLIGVNEHAAVGFISSLATSVTTFGLMEKMDKKGAMLNAAFATSAAFTFAGHLAFTLAFDASYLAPMIVGKLVAGVCSVILAILIYRRLYQKKTEQSA
jgi:ethanolamine transporter